MLYNKCGWIRILEATIAVLIVSSTLIIVYSNQPTRDRDLGEYMYNLQKQILLDINSKSDLRGYVLNGSEDSLNSLNLYIYDGIPIAFKYSIKVCDLGETGKCKLNESEVIETKDRDVFAEEIIIAADFDGYNPKKVRLFVWEKG